jgi:hypothetical protein
MEYLLQDLGCEFWSYGIETRRGSELRTLPGRAVRIGRQALGALPLVMTAPLATGGKNEARLWGRARRALEDE